MLRPLFIGLFVLLAATLWQSQGRTAPLPGQDCGNRDQMIARLKEKFHETRLMEGIDDRGAVIELLTSEDGKTYTLLVTWPGGFSCLLSGGTNWQPVQLPGKPS